MRGADGLLNIQTQSKQPKVNYSSPHTCQQYVWNAVLVHNASCHVHFQLGKNKAPPKRQAEASE